MLGRSAAGKSAWVLICTILIPCWSLTWAASPVTPHLPENQASAHPIEQLFSSYRFQKGYEESLALISSLSLPHSCLYSSLTESIISKCSSSPTVLDGEEKTFFATKLAICELSSANVDYPRECKGGLLARREIQRCLRRLESRPQWWTSWSNCLQSVGVLCNAVREEAGREHLLRLHRNLTVLHHNLERQLAMSLDVFSSKFKHVDNLSSMLQAKLALIVDQADSILNQAILPIDKRLQQLSSLVDGISQLETTLAMKLAEQNALQNERAESQRMTMEKNDRTLEHIADAMALLETKMTDRIKQDEESRLGQVEMQMAVKSSAEGTLDAIRESMQALSTFSSEASSTIQNLLESITQGKELMDGMNTDFDTLSTAHERISSSMRSQQSTSLNHLAGIDMFVARLNDTLHDVFAESTKYLTFLEDSQAHFRTQERSAPLGWADLLPAVYLPLLISFLVLVNRKRSATIVFAVALLYVCCLTYHRNGQGDGALGTTDFEEAADGLFIEGRVKQGSEHLQEMFGNAMRLVRDFYQNRW
ncbi:hypothetical protein TWF696_004088 [Orbilia brochopaga]|uniref:Uncharacterized protein n=1 Tax=Orbilia brochopaga TaxID=3140254 RepID=A0AAV9V5X3_9PEZI